VHLFEVFRQANFREPPGPARSEFCRPLCSLRILARSIVSYTLSAPGWFGNGTADVMPTRCDKTRLFLETSLANVGCVEQPADYHGDPNATEKPQEAKCADYYEHGTEHQHQ